VAPTSTSDGRPAPGSRPPTDLILRGNQADSPLSAEDAVAVAVAVVFYRVLWSMLALV
jgi:hypothetical protein